MKITIDELKNKGIYENFEQFNETDYEEINKTLQIDLDKRSYTALFVEDFIKLVLNYIKTKSYNKQDLVKSLEFLNNETFSKNI